MKRRAFFALLGGSLAIPLASRAQQPAIPVVGLLTNASYEGFSDALRAFRQGLDEIGFVEGRNLTIEIHEAEGSNDRLSALAAGLVRRRISAIVTSGIATTAAKAATATIPIIFFTGADPIERGFVANLSRPGGNLTGVTVLADFLGPKRLQLLHEMLPAATRIGLLVNPPSGITDAQLQDLQAAAKTLGMELLVLNVSFEQDFEAAFATLAQKRADGLVISPHPFFTSKSDLLAALAIRHALPAIYQWREFAAAGGLMSYGSRSLTDAFHLVGVYAGRVLKGENPGDLPVQQSTKFELTINLKTAKALGLAVPPTLRAAADEVIE